MLDINSEAEKALSQLACSVVYQHPVQFTEMPAVSYYNVSELPALRADNSDCIQSGYIQTDVWAKDPLSCSETAAQVNGVMQNDGWTREMSRDIPETKEKIFHITMRFHKYFTL